MTVPFRPSSIGWGFLAFIIGALPAFGLAGPALFADGAMAERLLAVAAYALAVFVLAIGGGAFAPAHRLSVSIGMALPALIVLLLMEWGEPWSVGLGAAVIAGAAAGTLAGTLVGSRVAAAAIARNRDRGTQKR